MKQVFKHNTLKETSRSNSLACTSKQNHKRSKEKGRRRSGLNKNIVAATQEATLPSSNVRLVRKRDTLRKTVGNCTLEKHPKHFQKRKKKRL
jgi:hypothetical protein